MDMDIVKKKVYVPGISRSVKETEELTYDPKAYLLLHTFETEYPCLSFDVIPDSLGVNRQSFPMTSWIVTGTQADKSHSNQLMVMRLSNMHANKSALKSKAKGSKNDDVSTSRVKRCLCCLE
uniref:Histone-binding protein RBBP4 N-terminal domain-containing protein n=1 Tax=Meloidogyne javanica TaxID=6303 RepID=A0A915N529_MELJA